MKRNMARYVFFAALIFAFLATCAVLLAGMYFYIRLTRDLPRIERVSDYRPKAVTSIFAVDGSLIAEQFDERRYPVSFAEVPDVVKNAFLAAEDADFYKHPGIDFKGIVRALVVNLRTKKTRQGASTITQQVVKSLLLSREKTYERKAKEAILSYRLEHALTKDEIFSIYLNQAFLGSGAYGVRAASRVHFHKELTDLTIAEAAFLAGLPQKPTELSKVENRQDAINRQHYVLEQMRRHSMISEEERVKALAQPLTIYAAEQQTFFDIPYFSGHVVRSLDEVFKQIGRHMTPTNPGGFAVQTTADIAAHRLASKALERSLRELERRQGWRGPLKTLAKADEIEGFVKASGPAEREPLAANRLYPAVVRKIDVRNSVAEVQVGAKRGSLDLKKSEWANRLAARKMTEDGEEIVATGIKLATYLKPGHVIEVVVDEERTKRTKEGEPDYWFILDQTPEVEGALVALNALTGEVFVILGGLDYQRSQFNRATQAKLQPGSSFKPFIYLSALEQLHYTPTTIVHDSPISMVAGNGEIWAPKNFDKKYLGPITLRTALQRSRNVVSVYLLQRIGVDHVISTARRLGISTPIPRNMSISLGTAEVYLIEMVRAYGAFATGGWLADPLLVSSIRDRDGKLVYEQRPKQKKVIDEDDAFILANMMKGVVERGTAQVVSKLNRPIAGKTGTTNGQMDAWFIGYTPEWVCGIWVGYDVKHALGHNETGGRVAAPVFVYFMDKFLADKPADDFEIPDGVIPVPIDLGTGHVVEPDTPGAFVEYFKSGTEPSFADPAVSIPQDYLSNSEF